MSKSKNDVKTRIRKFLEGEPITLSSEEEKILTRWEKANDLLTEKVKTWQEIRDFIAMRFVVSKFTAENDIVNAQEVFGTNRKINKRYLMHLHLDRLDYDYERARKRIFKTATDEETGKQYELPVDAKELAALARMAEAYTYALNSIPHDDGKIKLPPPIFVLKLPEGVELPLAKLNDLLSYADQYIDYQIVDNGTVQSPGSTGEGKSDAAAPSDDQDDQS